MTKIYISRLSYYGINYGFGLGVITVNDSKVRIYNNAENLNCGMVIERKNVIHMNYGK